MDDLISREAAVDAVLSEERYCERNMDDETTAAVQMARFKLEKVPVVDVAPVVHARWIETTIPANTTGHGGVGQDKKKGRLCSNCRCAFDAVLLWCDSFCPNCGAKMDGERRDDDARISEAPGGGGDRQAAAV